jgi:hypothetical protein
MLKSVRLKGMNARRGYLMRFHKHSLSCFRYAPWLSVVGALFLISGCLTTDHSSDPQLANLVNRCFRTINEALFVSRRCEPLVGHKYCDSAVMLGPNENSPRGGYPPTLQAYRSNPVYWSSQIHKYEKVRQRGQIGADHVVIYGGLRPGTRLKIVQVLRWFNGENGNFWIAFAMVQDGEFKGRRLFVPDESGARWPWLITPYGPDHRPTKYPVVDPRFLSPCSD